MTPAQVLAGLRTRINDPDWPEMPTRELVLDVAGGDKTLALTVLDLLNTAQEDQFAEAVADPDYVGSDTPVADHARGLIDRVEAKARR